MSENDAQKSDEIELTSEEERRFLEKALIDVRMLIERELDIVARYFQFRFKHLTYIGLPLSYGIDFGFDAQEDNEVMYLNMKVTIPKEVIRKIGIIYKERFKEIKKRLRHARIVDRFKYVGAKDEFSE